MSIILILRHVLKRQIKQVDKKKAPHLCEALTALPQYHKPVAGNYFTGTETSRVVNDRLVFTFRSLVTVMFVAPSPLGGATDTLMVVHPATMTNPSRKYFIITPLSQRIRYR